jgi:hypothetical protein
MGGLVLGFFDDLISFKIDWLHYDFLEILLVGVTRLLCLREWSLLVETVKHIQGFFDGISVGIK